MQEFQLNAAWLEKIYNNVRKKLCERKSYQKTKKDLEHQKETAMKQQNKSIVEGEKMGSLSKLPVYSAKDALEGGRDGQCTPAGPFPQTEPLCALLTVLLFIVCVFVCACLLSFDELEQKQQNQQRQQRR